MRAERDEQAVAGHVVQRFGEPGFGDYTSLASARQAQMGGRSLLLIPARTAGVGSDALSPDYQRLSAIVCEAAWAVSVRAVGEVAIWPSAPISTFSPAVPSAPRHHSR